MEEHIEAVQRMQDYIEDHLDEDITLASLSLASHFSPWYSHRLFTAAVGISPADYIRRLRLSQSALRLRDEKMKIIDIAFAAGFSSVDGYQRAFLREFGCNPNAYAKNPIPIGLFTPYGVKFRVIERRESETMENLRNIFIQVVEKPQRKVIIKRGVKADDYFTYCEEVGCEIWGLLRSIKSLSGEPVSMWLPPQYITDNTSCYVQGVEVARDYSGEIPEGLDLIELPAAKFLMFQGEPFREEDYCQAIAELSQAVKGYDPSVIGYCWDKSNPKIQLEPIGNRGYIELHPIKTME